MQIGVGSFESQVFGEIGGAQGSNYLHPPGFASWWVRANMLDSVVGRGPAAACSNAFGSLTPF